MAYRDEPAGIGGWLLVFIISYAVGMIAALAASIFQYVVTPRWFAGLSMTKTYYEIIFAILVGQTMIVGTILWRLLRVRNRLTVWLTIVALWVSPFAGRSAAVAAEIILMHSGWHVRSDMLFGALALQAVYSGIWTAYLLFSPRVVNTYNRSRRVDTLAEAFA